MTQLICVCDVIMKSLIMSDLPQSGVPGDVVVEDPLVLEDLLVLEDFVLQSSKSLV